MTYTLCAVVASLLKRSVVVQFCRFTIIVWISRSTDAYCTVIMLASTADSTLSSSLNAAIDANLSGSGVDGDRTSVWVGPHAPWASMTTGMGLGGKKDEETRTVLRRRLSSSSICFFSWRMEARSSESVSIRPSGKQQNKEDNDHENIYWSYWPFLCSLVADLWKTTSGNSSKWYDKYKMFLYLYLSLVAASRFWASLWDHWWFVLSWVSPESEQYWSSSRSEQHIKTGYFREHLKYIKDKTLQGSTIPIFSGSSDFLV